jgi:DNA-binding response OmpR family regulator
MRTLDNYLPDISGLDICRRIRSHGSLFATPVIMLTGQAGLEEKEAGFAAGADQYLVKPVSPRELILWVQALLRRLGFDNEEGVTLAVGDLEIDKTSYLVRFQGQVMPHLTGKEFDLLYFLVKHRPKVLSRKQILSQLWHTITVDRVVDTHISTLRRKLPTLLSDRIQNLPGRGFRYFE